VIRKESLKRLIAQATVVGALLAAFGLFVLGARVALANFAGAGASQALHDVPELPASVQNHAVWLPDEWHGDRTLEPNTRRQLEAAYVDAWEGIARYQETGDPATVNDWLAGPARQQALAAPVTYRRQTWALRHRLALTFYGLDGTTVAITDRDATMVYATGSGALQTITTSQETYDSVLTLEDGYWRIRQLRRLGSQVLTRVSTPMAGSAEQNSTGPVEGPTRVDQSAPAPTAKPSGPTARAGAEVSVDWTAATEASALLPATAASFDRQSVRADLDGARAIGLNLVGITVPADTFGAIPSKQGIALIRQVLTMAAADGLRVEVTIDGSGTDRAVATWTQADRRLEAVVSGLAGHPALALWNLGQDPDGWPTPTAQRQAWLVRAALRVHQLDPAVPVTIGWQESGSALDPALARAVDVISLPWRGTAAELPTWVGAVQALGRPIVLEVSADSWNGIWPGGRTENQQAAWLGQVIGGARTLGVATVCVSALRDGQTMAASRLPWVAGPALDSGLLRRDRSAKPAAAVVGRDQPAPAAGAVREAVRKPFSWVVLIALTLSVPGLPRRLVRLVRRVPGEAGRALRRV
jgi:hypothetical protein